MQIDKSIVIKKKVKRESDKVDDLTIKKILPNMVVLTEEVDESILQVER